MKVSKLFAALHDHKEVRHPVDLHLNRLAVNIPLVPDVVFGLRDKGRIAVTTGGKTREYRISRFLTKYWPLMADIVRAWDSYEKFEARVKENPETYGTQDDYRGTIQWISDHWYYVLDQRGLSHEILNGGDIYTPYALIESCMSDNDALDLYAMNPDKVQLLHITDENGETVGRALLWKTDEGATVLDRVYPSNNGRHSIYARRLAKKEGWVYRECDSAGDNSLSDGKKYTVTLRDVEHYPYTDTFFYGRQEAGNLILSMDWVHGAERLDNTDDTNPFVPSTYCYHCDERFDEEDMNIIDGEHVCKRCTDNIYRWSEYEDRYIHKDEAYYLWNDDYVSEDHAVELTTGEYSGEYALRYEVVEDEEGEVMLESEAVRLFNGQWALKADTTVIEYGPNKGFRERDDRIEEWEHPLTGVVYLVERDFEYKSIDEAQTELSL